ncbi:uncharacterized protein LOC129772944 [Toxorhynchites rutilus septentrionalis]|uniref:uncharacterized protein LOC129772944 n=1 Tax=Toxorhynchites rutilus septentrionalis TaxID=329112 RepID=UPI00247A7BB9|nr:uncharacterized protein LOC129772944 [Toxorhynchites rutilus septentrionalis]
MLELIYSISTEQNCDVSPNWPENPYSEFESKPTILQKSGTENEDILRGIVKVERNDDMNDVVGGNNQSASFTETGTAVTHLTSVFDNRDVRVKTNDQDCTYATIGVIDQRTHTEECLPEFRSNRDIVDLHGVAKKGTSTRLTCELCGKAYFSEDALVHHRLKHKDTNECDFSYLCSYCDRSFTTKYRKECHEQSHTKSYKYKCRFCDKGSILRKTILCHEAQEHSYISADSVLHSCSVCGKTFAHVSTLALHESSHSSEHPVECERCDKKFKNVHQMKHHLRTYHLKNQRKLERKKPEPIILEPLTDGILIEVEMNESDDPDNDHQKLEDGRNFHQAGMIANVIEMPRNHCCDHCDETFFHRRSLFAHRAKIHGIEERDVMVRAKQATKYPCEDCDKTFFHKLRLSAHRAKIHGIGEKEVIEKAKQRKRYSCVDCNKHFFHRHRYNDHRTKVHFIQNIKAPPSRLTCDTLTHQRAALSSSNKHVLNHNSPPLNERYLSSLQSYDLNMTLFSFTEEGVNRKLCCLEASKGAGPDKLQPSFIKACSSSLALPSSLLFNRSLREGQFPALWKTASIIQIHKAGDVHDVQNYRGISILNCIPKVFQSMLLDHIYPAVRHFIANEQHGFAKKRSTVTNLMSYVSLLIDKIKKRQQVDAIYVDFTKAFDRVPHTLAVEKLRRFGYPLWLTNWINSYLTDRCAYVQIGSSVSSLFSVTSGVPQGSHLCPWLLLFVLFVNDICTVLKSPKMMYADDLKLFRVVTSHADCCALQMDVNTLLDWCSMNGMEVNIRKCHAITFSRLCSPITFDYTMGSTEVERAAAVKDLANTISTQPFCTSTDVCLHCSLRSNLPVPREYKCIPIICIRRMPRERPLLDLQDVSEQITENEDEISGDEDRIWLSESGTDSSTKKNRGRPRNPRPSVLSISELQDNGEIVATDDKSASCPAVESRKMGRPAKQKAEDSSSESKRKSGRQKDSTKSNVTCEICGKFFKFRATLKQHEQIHYGIKEFECEVCHKRFLHKGTLKVHLRLHTGEMPYKCPHCPKRFRGQTALDCHVFRHTKQGTKCPQCSSIFATPSIVKQHIREVHTTERSHTCQICGVTYKHRKSLRLHLRNHQKRVCPDCGKVFHSVYAMMTHRKVHAQDHFQFRCSFCDRKFAKANELESHNKLRGRAFQCDMCCHSFNKADYLENHNRRNHWKEMGLEQLKVAPPKNGWNRKGVPKPKKTVTVSEPNVGATVDRVDSWNASGQPTVQSYIIYNPSQELQSACDQKAVESTDYNASEPHLDQFNSIVTTITTKIEPVLQQDVSDNLSLAYKNESDNSDQQDEVESEANADYSADDFGLINDAEDGYLEEESNFISNVKEDVAVKEEANSTKVEAIKLVITNDRVSDLGTEEVLAENTLSDADIKQDDSCSDSDEEVPLANLLSRRRGFQVKQSSDSLDNSQEMKTSIIKEEQTESKYKFEKSSSPEDDRHMRSSDEISDNPNVKKRSYTRRRRRRVVDEKQKDEKNRRKISYARREMICPFCGDSFKGRIALKQHKSSVHPDMRGHNGPFICELCGKSYATAASMVVHRGTHEAFQRYKCDECPKAFTYRCYLESHKRAEHLHERLVCPLCGKQFKYSQDLKVHTKQHEDEKPFKCDQCPSVFRYPSALRCHKALHVETVFSCDICNKDFKYANSLRVHKRLHTGVKRFRCEICDREFHTKAPLVRHLATHSVEREMKCVVCDRIFYKKIELVIHQTKEHPNHPMIGKTVKIHTCPVCGQEFTKKSNLKSHSYIHGETYKFKCDLCEDQKFKQHAGLRHHLTHFHKLEVRKRKPKEEREEQEGDSVVKADEEIRSTTEATLTPAVSVVHNGVEFIVQRIEFELK